MSNAPSTLDAQPSTELPDEPASQLLSLAESASELFTRPFEFAGFWSAVVLPFVYVPMLVGGVSASQQTTFVALIALHAVALVAGHGYRND